MAEYHVGCGLADIYAGTLNKAQNMWRNKSAVTAEALGAAAQYLFFGNKEYHFSLRGKKYILMVVEDGANETEGKTE
jgi:hypothetical protein